jgi:hypothetical protein
MDGKEAGLSPGESQTGKADKFMGFSKTFSHALEYQPCNGKDSTAQVAEFVCDGTTFSGDCYFDKMTSMECKYDVVSQVCIKNDGAFAMEWKAGDAETGWYSNPFTECFTGDEAGYKKGEDMSASIDVPLGSAGNLEPPLYPFDAESGKKANYECVGTSISYICRSTGISYLPCRDNSWELAAPEGQVPAQCPEEKEECNGRGCVDACGSTAIRLDDGTQSCETACVGKYPVHTPEMCGKTIKAADDAIMEMVAAPILLAFDIAKEAVKMVEDGVNGESMTSIVNAIVDVGKPFAHPRCPWNGEEPSLE